MRKAATSVNKLPQTLMPEASHHGRRGAMEVLCFR